jgi:hypothetical protein
MKTDELNTSDESSDSRINSQTIRIKKRNKALFILNLLILLLSLDFLCFAVSPAKADEHVIDHTDNDLSLWVMPEVTFPIYKDKVSGYFMALPIFINNLHDMNPLVLRSGILIHPTKKLTLSTGYDRNSDWTHEVKFNENRFWQQIAYSQNFKNVKRLKLSHRFRAEERRFDHIGTSVRLRYRAKATYDLGRNKKWYLAASNEILMNANTIKGRKSGFSEDRVFIGIGRRINKYITAEIGYQPALINVVEGKKDIIRHSILTYMSIKIPYKPRTVIKAKEDLSFEEKPKENFPKHSKEERIDKLITNIEEKPKNSMLILSEYPEQEKHFASIENSHVNFGNIKSEVQQ